MDYLSTWKRREDNTIRRNRFYFHATRIKIRQAVLQETPACLSIEDIFLAR